MNLREGLRRYHKRISAFGFVYRPYFHTALLFGMYFSVIAFGYFFKMHPAIFVILLMSVTILFPLLLYLQWEYSYEEGGFKEFTSYIQQVSATFKTYPKIHSAMKETLSILQGDLRFKVEESLAQMEEGVDYETALLCIEQEYPHYILQNLHRLMIAVEVHGAKQYQEGIHLLQDDLDDLIEDTYLHQKELLLIQRKVYVLCLLSIVISILSKNMLMGLYAFEKEALYQGVLLLFVLSLLGCIVLSQYFLRHTWQVWRKSQ